MTFKAWRTTSFSHTHENHAFNRLHDILSQHWRQTDEPLHLLGNVYVDGCEMDAIIIKRNALIIIDFKDYGGGLRFSENQHWLIDGSRVRGGNQRNPYQQIRKNKYQILNYLNQRVTFRHPHNLGHIAGLCLFQQKIDFDLNQLPPGISRWFHIADFSTAYRLSDAIVSTEINFSDDEIASILTALDLRPWHPDGITQEVDFPDYGSAQRPHIQLNNEQSQALAALNEWLSDDTCPVFALSGAWGTGKHTVLEALLETVSESGMPRRFLAPNARIARLHVKQPHNEVTSIYSWLYSHNPQGLKEDTPHYPISCKDTEFLRASQNALLVIFDAHLLGDEFFASETAFYGSGHLLSDLLQELRDETKEGERRPLPKILLLGDPYQLRRGAKEKSLLEGEFFKHQHIPFRTVELKSQYRGEASPIEQLDFQRELVGQLAAQKFVQLPVCPQQVVRTIARGEHTGQIAEALLDPANQCIYLCATHERAQEVNFGIRKKYLQASAPGQLVAGDRVELYTNTRRCGHQEHDLSQEKTLHAGVLATVTQSASGFFSKSINLNGREKPTVVDFAMVTLRYNGTDVPVLYLPEFLSSRKPELAADTLLALRIWARQEAESTLSGDKAELDRLKEHAKSSKDKSGQLSLANGAAEEGTELNEPENATQRYETAREHYQHKLNQLIINSQFTYVARLRYAWAMTVHRAQSYMPFNRVILEAVAAHDTDNPATDSYFRWLYTASTRTHHQLDILHYPVLTPLSKTDWHYASIRTMPLIVKQRFHFTKERIPSDSELRIALPVGFSPEVPELFALLLEVERAIQPAGWRIVAVTQHRYKERYMLQREQEEVELDLDYNGKFEVTLGKCRVLNGDAQLEDELKQHLRQPPLWREKSVDAAMKYIDARLAEKGWRIIDGEEKAYKVFVVAEHASGKIKLDINIPSEGSISRKGVISSIHLVQADSETVSEQFKADFIHG